MKYQEIEGDLIKLALEGNFDVIAHGCNCQCTMKSGLAPKMAEVFGVDKYPLESFTRKGDINKLGQIEWFVERDSAIPYVINAYTQFMYGTYHTDGIKDPLDYEALTLCLRKINHKFKGKHIGLPLIGCGLAGGIWDKTLETGYIELDFKDVKTIVQEELKDMDVTIVHYKK